LKTVISGVDIDARTASRRRIRRTIGDSVTDEQIEEILKAAMGGSF
jgi:nitroreductase